MHLKKMCIQMLIKESSTSIKIRSRQIFAVILESKPSLLLLAFQGVSKFHIDTVIFKFQDSDIIFQVGLPCEKLILHLFFQVVHGSEQVVVQRYLISL